MHARFILIFFLSPSNASGVFSIGLNISVTISGLKTINTSSAIGGGVFNAGTLTLSNCAFTGGAASFGGGVANSSFGTLTLTACTISGNSARAGGGGAGLYNQGKLTVTDCTIANNNTDATNGVGGGIYNDSSSTLTVSDSTTPSGRSGG